MPIKIFKNRRINILRQLVTIKLSISDNSKIDFVFAQKNAARCISGQNKKNILGIGNPKQKGLRRVTAFFCGGNIRDSCCLRIRGKCLCV